MSNNPFEQYVNDARAGQQPTSALTARERLEQINRDRGLTHDGHTPLELWGEQAAKLCAEFLQFAGATALGSPDEPTRRYAIAYIGMPHAAGTTIPEPEVFLYQDGLVRVGPDGR